MRRGQIAYYARDRAGKRDRLVFLNTDFDEATWKLARRRARGVPADEQTLVRDAWSKWMGLCRDHWKEKSRGDLEARFTRYIDPLLGRMQASRLTADDTRRLAQRLRKEKELAVRTQYHILTQWGMFARWLMESRIATEPVLPARGEKWRPQVPDTEPDPFTEEELEELRRVAEPYRFAVRLMLATALRWSDIVRLEAKHLKADGTLEIACSKTGKLLRVPVCDAALVREMRQRVGRLVSFSKNSVGSFDRRVSRLTGVRFTTYRLKDTFACRWLDAGGSLVDLQHIIGHSDPRTTLRYGRPSDRRIIAEARRIGAAWETGTAGTETGTDH